MTSVLQIHFDERRADVVIFKECVGDVLTKTIVGAGIGLRDLTSVTQSRVRSASAAGGLLRFA